MGALWTKTVVVKETLERSREIDHETSREAVMSLLVSSMSREFLGDSHRCFMSVP